MEMTLSLHRCKVCGTRWLLWPDAIHGGGWNLLDKYQRAGGCCDNVAMGDQIEHLRDFDLGHSDAHFQRICEVAAGNLARAETAESTLADLRRQGEWQPTFGDVVTAAAALHDELKPFVPSGQLNNNGPARSVIERHIAQALAAGRPLPDPPKEGQ